MQIDDASSAADAADILGVFDDRVPPQAPRPRLRCPAEASLTPRAPAPGARRFGPWLVRSIGELAVMQAIRNSRRHEPGPAGGES